MCCAMTGDHTFIPQPFDNSETKVASCRRSRLWPSASQSCNLSTAPFRIQHSSNEVRRNSQQPFHRPNPVEAHCKGFKVLRTWLVESAFSASSRRASACSWVSCCISSYQTNSTNGANSKQNEIAVHMLQAFRASCKCVQIPKLRISSWFVSVLGGLVAIIFLDFLRAEQMRTNVTVQVGSWILIIHILVSKHTQISVVSFIIEAQVRRSVCCVCDLWMYRVGRHSEHVKCQHVKRVNTTWTVKSVAVSTFFSKSAGTIPMTFIAARTRGDLRLSICDTFSYRNYRNSRNLFLPTLKSNSLFWSCFQQRFVNTKILGNNHSQASNCMLIDGGIGKACTHVHQIIMGLFYHSSFWDILTIVSVSSWLLHCIISQSNYLICWSLANSRSRLPQSTSLCLCLHSRNGGKSNQCSGIVGIVVPYFDLNDLCKVDRLKRADHKWLWTSLDGIADNSILCSLSHHVLPFLRPDDA